MKEILIDYIPWISALVGFCGAGFAFLKQLATILRKSNLDDVKNQIMDENSKLNDKLDSLVESLSNLAKENAQLKSLNKKLIGELKRISNYEEE